MLITVPLAHHDLVRDQIRKQEMAEVARNELALHPIHGLLKAMHGHVPGVIYEDVKSAYKAVDLCGCFANGCVVGEVALSEGEIDLRIGLLDLLDDRVYFRPDAPSDQKLAGMGALARVFAISAPMPFSL